MSEPEEPLIIPMGEKSSGGAKRVALAALVVVAGLGGWIAVEHFRDTAVQEKREEQLASAAVKEEERRQERRDAAGSGIPLSEAHKPPPGWKPPKNRVPSKLLFARGDDASDGLVPTTLTGGLFGIRLPATWEHNTSGGLMRISAPNEDFLIVVAAGTHADDGNTKAAIDRIGAVNCNWRQGDGPRRGKLGSQRIPAFFNEGACAHTDGYGLIWIVRLYAGDTVTSLVARYSTKAGEDAEEQLIRVLRSIVPVDG